MRIHLRSLAAGALASALVVTNPPPVSASLGSLADRLTDCLELGHGSECDLAEIGTNLPAPLTGVTHHLPHLPVDQPLALVPEVLGAVPDVRSLVPETPLFEAPAVLSDGPVGSAPEIDPSAVGLALALAAGVLALHERHRRPT